MSPSVGCEKTIVVLALPLAAAIEDSSATVEIIKAFVSVDQVVNCIASVCRICVGLGEGGRKIAVVWKRDLKIEENKYLSGD